MKHQPIIRKATARDMERMSAMHRRSVTLSCRDHYTPDQIRAWTNALAPAAYEPAIAARHCIVACAGEAVLGLGIMSPEEGEINAVYVDPDHAGRGLGGLILSELEAAARRRGVTELTVFSTLNARQFYQNKGYRDHRPATHSLPDGTQLECIEMRKRLD